MGKYDDIMYLEAPISKTHKHMSNNDRAAQFLPFAALTGYDAAILETARQVAEKKTISNEIKLAIGEKINKLNEVIKAHPSVCITYFEQDLKKDGGKYNTIESNIQKIIFDEKTLVLSNGQKIRFDDIYLLESLIFESDINYYF